MQGKEKGNFSKPNETKEEGLTERVVMWYMYVLYKEFASIV